MNILKNMIVVLLLQACACIAWAQNSSSFSKDHLAAAERLVYAMGMPERFGIPTRLMMQESQKKDPDHARLMSATFEPFLTKKYTGDHLKEFFASQFDMDTCRKIAEFWEGPVGKKLVATQVKLLSTGDAPELAFTPKEKARIKQFEATPASQAFLAAMPGIEERLAEFTRDTQMKMRELFLNELTRQETAAKS